MTPSRGAQITAAMATPMTDHISERIWLDEQGKEEVAGTFQGMDAQANLTGGSSAPPSREVLDDKPGIVALVTDAIPGNFMDIASPEALPDVPNTSIFTRATNPFKPECVAAILKLVKTGPDLIRGVPGGGRNLRTKDPA
ncbi:unnamed protein product [Mycena citricolor]|uniref:Uncharacterized protein n=1 Tax=Mycena citricolor TaxID=2018698 RepID=A0AAD2HYY1_9AGAR|nr:unnamed protein product [Mycena citricolor]